MLPLFPRALRPGDEIAVVSPAGAVRDAAAMERGILRWSAWGFRPTLLPHAAQCLDWPAGSPLAATDDERLEDLQRAIAEPRFRAVVLARGGYGLTRILDRVDFAPLQRDPKPIVGYSDATALLAAARQAVGITGFHGPMLATTEAMDAGPDGWSLQRELLTATDRAPRLPAADTAIGIGAGTAEGPLVGGNLSLVQCLCGTRWQLATDGALLFLEDTGEAPYRVDRMLTQLLQTGVLARAAGIVLGDFHLADTPFGSDAAAMNAVLEERLGSLSIPVARGFPFGHRPGAWTLPTGVRARLSVAARGGSASLQLLEPAVRA